MQASLVKRRRGTSALWDLIAPARLISESGPEIAHKLQEDAADGVLLAPVCPFCHQAAGLLQSIIEKAGIATVSISLLAGHHQTRRAAACPRGGQAAGIPFWRTQRR